MKKIVMSGLAAVFMVLAVFAGGCSDSSSRYAAICPVPEPGNLNASAIQTGEYGPVAAPVTSGVPHGVTVWITRPILSYTGPSAVRKTTSRLRPGERLLPYERILEEVVLTEPEYDTRIPAGTVGPPPGWQVVATVGWPVLRMSDQPRQATDQFGRTVWVLDPIFVEAVSDVGRRVIWAQSSDDAVTPEGLPMMRSLAKELRRAWVYELALVSGDPLLSPDSEALSVGPYNSPSP